MTWLYIPSGCCPSVQGSVALNLDSNLPARRLASCVTWRGKLSPLPFWSHAWQTAYWMRLLSGLTRRRSTLSRGLGSWMESLLGIRVRVSPVTARPLTAGSRWTRGTSGPTCTGSSPKSGPGGASSRTCPTTSRPGSHTSRSASKGSGTRSGARSPRQGNSEPHTSGSASSFWPTPAARDWKGSPAPIYREGRLMEDQLDRAAFMWYRRFRRGSGKPKAGLHHLNPWFWEWMMGWPTGWTAFEPVERESFLSWRRSHSSLLCAALSRQGEP